MLKEMEQHKIAEENYKIKLQESELHVQQIQSSMTDKNNCTEQLNKDVAELRLELQKITEQNAANVQRYV